MLKFIPLVLLAGLVTTSVVSAPKPVKEGLVAHEAAGKAYVVRTRPDTKQEWWVTANLKVRYAIAGMPGETYTVELWLRLPDEPVESQRGPGHFDTQTATVPGEVARLTEVEGLFDRRHYDRREEDLEELKKRPTPSWFQLKPGTYCLPPVILGKAWECRLVVKKKGKILTDTGYFRVVRPAIIEL
jgi:hypothetical protein